MGVNKFQPHSSTNKTVSFLVGCVYRPPLSSIDNGRILVDFIFSTAGKHNNTFIFGDFNLPDISWPLDTNRIYSGSSQLLVELLVNSHLNEMVSQPTRYRSNQEPSTLDFIISSDSSSLVNLEYLDLIGK